VFSSNVQPKRRIHARPTAWHCTCREPPGTYRLNDAHLTRCPVCGVPRRDKPAAGRQRAFASIEARGADSVSATLSSASPCS